MSDKVSMVRVLTAATGNGTTITLGARYSDLFMTPADAGAIDGRIYTWLIVDGNNFELVRGAYHSSGTTMDRTKVMFSRISGTLGTTRISLSGSAQVRIVEAAVDMDGLRGTRAVSSTSDVISATDLGFAITYTNASAIAVSLAQAGTANLDDGWATWVQNLGAGTLTITPATSTVNGAAALILATNLGAMIWSDGSNYHAYILAVAKPLLASNNLSELPNITNARTNLGVLSAGTHADTDFVRFDAAQSPSSAQQLQARQNAFAAPFDAMSYNGLQLNASIEISQENGTTARTTDGYIVDNWRIDHIGTMAFSAAQVADAPVGFTNSIKVSITTAESSMGISDYINVSQFIEGYRTSKLSFGGANAQNISIIFATKHHRTGIYTGFISNSAGNRAYPFSYTQSVADTWQINSVTIPGDTTGTWIGNTNGIGLKVGFAIAVGTNFAGVLNSWAAGGLGGIGNVNGVGATSDTFQISSVFIFPGNELPSTARLPFISRPYDQEIILCKRHFRTGLGTSMKAFSSSGVNGTIIHDGMRIAPSVSASAALLISDVSASNFTQSSANIAINGIQQTADAGSYNLSNFSGLTTNSLYMMYPGSGGGLIRFDARL